MSAWNMELSENESAALREMHMRYGSLHQGAMSQPMNWRSANEEVYRNLLIKVMREIEMRGQSTGDYYASEPKIAEIVRQMHPSKDDYAQMATAGAPQKRTSYLTPQPEPESNLLLLCPTLPN